MFGKSQKAIAEWPVTKQISGGFHITGKYLPPGIIKPMQVLYVIVAAILLFNMVGSASHDNIIAVLIFSIAGFWAFYRFYYLRLITPIVGKSVDVKIMADSIQVKQLFSYKKYSRGMPIEFRIDRHQKALQEQAKEVETNKKQPSTYRQAVEVVMQYGENRVVIAEMPETDMEKARADDSPWLAQ